MKFRQIIVAEIIVCAKMSWNTQMEKNHPRQRMQTGNLREFLDKKRKDFLLQDVIPKNVTKWASSNLPPSKVLAPS